jgi:hypothetical protein
MSALGSFNEYIGSKKNRFATVFGFGASQSEASSSSGPGFGFFQNNAELADFKVLSSATSIRGTVEWTMMYRSSAGLDFSDPRRLSRPLLPIPIRKLTGSHASLILNVAVECAA